MAIDHSATRILTRPIGRARRPLRAVTTPAAGSPAIAESPLSLRRRREAAHRTRVFASDAVIATAAALLASVAGTAAVDAATLSAAVVTASVWLLALATARSRDPLLSFADEVGRVCMATGAAFGTLAIGALLLSPEQYRPLLAAAPLGLVAMAGARAAWRHRLRTRTRAGEHVSRAVVLAREQQLAAVGDALGRIHAVEVADAIGFEDHEAPAGVTRRVADACALRGADTVIVAGSPQGDPEFLRQLSWALEGVAAETVVWTGLSGLSAPRLRVRWSGHTPLLRVTMPLQDSADRFVRRAFDILVAAVLLVPVALAAVPIGIAIRMDSPGPVLFRQVRIGEGGRPFRMLKFRSMTVTAERDRALLSHANEGAGPLFKVRDDPRVTRVGRILRRYSLDELPQFWNVLRGDMSVIGPRPALPEEVAAYRPHEARRLAIRPGISGPWQVSGRSELSWQQAVGLDLHYVENRTLPGDLLLLLRTVLAVVRPRGAY
ncbi:sugar transferase [Microbacterium album]|uniref:Polyprenyl glycosylphosphotransferase n=1 Tax=Microbacterium album TaxID=2053191 RepID=A0A917IDP1_9MICO|nr:sugar transferase [Microbacterium album]GGH38077.1 polyprenyl glycosylphosphotransferase [Microbacterium album]